MPFPAGFISPLELTQESSVRFGTSGVRALVSDLDSRVCHAFAAAFVHSVAAGAKRVALAADLRPSSPDIAAACAAAVARATMLVDYCGTIPTPALAWYAQMRGIPAIMVTGSHIPFDRNGIKFYSAAGEITKADETRILHASVALPDEGLSAELPAVNGAALASYIDRYLDFFAPQCLAGMRLGVYQHSSVARDMLCDVLARLGAEVVALARTDEFVPIDTEAVSAGDVRQGQEWARQYGFDAIVSTDGDGDRPLFGDETGNWFRGDIVGILCAQFLEARAVVTTVSCNTAVELCASFATVKRTRIGSPYVIAGIEELVARGEKSVVGFEPNGGVLVGTSIEKDGCVLAPLVTRDALLPILCLLALAREKGCPLSDLPRRLPGRFTASDRLQSFATETSREILAGLAASTDKACEFLAGLANKVTGFDQTDGLRIFLADDEIVHLRPSGNAPELRCYAEAASFERAEKLVRECLLRMQAQRARGEADTPSNAGRKT